MVWFWPSRDVKMLWFSSSRDVGIVWWHPLERRKRWYDFGFLERRWFSLIFALERRNFPLRLSRWYNGSRGIPYGSRGRKSLEIRKKPWQSYMWLFWNKKDLYWNRLNLVTSYLFHSENGYHICIIFQICFTTSAPSSGVNIDMCKYWIWSSGVNIDFAPHIKDETWNEDIYCSSFQGWIENLG